MDALTGKLRTSDATRVALIVAALVAVAAIAILTSFNPVLTVAVFGGAVATFTVWSLFRVVQSGLDLRPHNQFLLASLVLAMVSLVPIQLRDPTGDELGFQAYYEVTLQALAVGLLLVVLAGKRVKVPVTMPLLLWTAFGAWALLSAYWAPQTELAALKGLQLITISVVTATVASQFRDRYDGVRFLAWVTVLILFGAILYQAIVSGPDSLIAGYDLGRERLSVLALHPLVLGGFSGAMAILLLVHRPRGADWIAFGVLATLTALADARAPLAMLAVTVIAYLYLRSSYTRYARVGAVVVSSVVALFLLASVLVVANTPVYGSSVVLPDIESQEIRTLNGRIPLWQAVFERGQAESEIEQGVLVGHGFASFRHFGLDEFGYGGDAHNAAIQVFFELGTLGMLLWIAAIVASGLMIWRGARDTRARLIAVLPLAYILVIQTLEASMADSRSFLLVILLFYAHVGLTAHRSPSMGNEAANGGDAYDDTGNAIEDVT